MFGLPLFCYYIYIMKEIKEMINSAFSAKEAKEMLRLWHSCGKISQAQLEKGYKLVAKSFE